MIDTTSAYSSGSMLRAEQSLFATGISSEALMNNAAHAVYTCISSKVPEKLERITVVCGKGNNGGDGYALGCILIEKGYDTVVIYTEEPVSESSLHYWDRYLENGGMALKYNEDENAAAARIFDSTLIVDALFGIGFKGRLDGDALSVVNAVNESFAYVVSVDIPSGVPADSGFCDGKNVSADLTVTFTAKKAAHLVYPAAEYCGETVVADIGMPSSFVSEAEPALSVIDGSSVGLLIPRTKNSHKGTYGTLKALVGSPSMPGAAVLSVSAALRAGVGLVRVFTDRRTADILNRSVFEPIVEEYSSPESFVSSRSGAVMIGCGIGREYDDDLYEILTEEKSTVILDADGINFVSENIGVLSERKSPTVMTPHPGEMARLLGKSVSEVQKHRLEYASYLASECKCTLVLKGANTVIANENGELFVNVTGNSGLSKGGSGDVLTGIIASLCAQGNSPLISSEVGVYVHGRSADDLKEMIGERGMLPSDIIAKFPHYLK